MLLLAQKTSQVLLHMSVAFTITYVFTGSLATGGLAAIVEPVCNVVLLPLHDRLWARLRKAAPRAWFRSRNGGSAAAAA
ncbi:DUF2061 domain-containing protein [Parapusillimonas granuli]|uniref:DUF2061 domain-containing protein n=1 Tax=Parapusillimonas granuli TaxID=380911 RepID=A0A853FSD5_9BURK|nr:DUF2061 domain-containing protein [Parapusillimonas granuli]MBB5214827.1 putative membrane protein [Parapusillimonas granuli]MEB2397925.1 DUF2061 domain-containing protein [Alcaligenaceae bacterium]NYT48765.1 DUF2061 domain-containing protein [Parapusillimonas granuli]